MPKRATSSRNDFVSSEAGSRSIPKRHFVSITAGVCVGRMPERAILSATSSSPARACPQNSTSVCKALRRSSSERPSNHSTPSATGLSPCASSFRITSCAYSTASHPHAIRSTVRPRAPESSTVLGVPCRTVSSTSTTRKAEGVLDQGEPGSHGPAAPAVRQLRTSKPQQPPWPGPIPSLGGFVAAGMTVADFPSGPARSPEEAAGHPQDAPVSPPKRVSQVRILSGHRETPGQSAPRRPWPE